MCGTLGVCQPGATPPPASSPTYPLDIGADIARLAAHDGITTSAWTAKILAAIRSLKPRLELPHAMSRAEGDSNRRHYHVVRAEMPSGPGSTTTSPGASRPARRAAAPSMSFASPARRGPALDAAPRPVGAAAGG